MLKIYYEFGKIIRNENGKTPPGTKAVSQIMTLKCSFHNVLYYSSQTEKSCKMDNHNPKSASQTGPNNNAVRTNWYFFALLGQVVR